MVTPDSTSASGSRPSIWQPCGTLIKFEKESSLTLIRLFRGQILSSGWMLLYNAGSRSGCILHTQPSVSGGKYSRMQRSSVWGSKDRQPFGGSESVLGRVHHQLLVRIVDSVSLPYIVRGHSLVQAKSPAFFQTDNNQGTVDNILELIKGEEALRYPY